MPQFLLGSIGIQEVQPGMPAEQAGLRSGDAIQSVDGHPFHMVTTLLAYMKAGEGKPLTLVIVRNGVALAPIVARPTKIQNGWKLGFIAAAPPYRNEPLPIGKAIVKSRVFCADKSLMIFEVLGGHRAHGRRRCGDKRMGIKDWAGRNDQPQPRHP